MTIRARFAPSPTGYLHIGNARTALINWLFARKMGGEFWLRLDDTDTQRSEERYAQALEEDLAWLGLTYDTFFKQSDRLPVYDEVRDRLIASGRLYPCYETQEDLDFKRKRQLSKGLPPIYDRGALALTGSEKQAYEESGQKPHWRFLLNHAPISWTDLVRGEVTYHGEHLSDPVLIRADGSYLYTFTSVVDDLDFKVTHVLRGEDHVTNTAVQAQLFEAIGGHLTNLHFGHFTLLVDESGHALSKRLGSLSLKGMREEGIEPMAINSLLARLGTSLPVEARSSLNELVTDFDVIHFSRTPPRFDIQELRQMNRKVLHHLAFEDVQDKLKHYGATHLTEPMWMLIRENLATLKESLIWQDILQGDVRCEVKDPSFFQTAATLLPPTPWSPETWKQWTEAVKAETGRKGRDLFLPLRLALTGLEHGPEMKDLLPILGRERTLKRLVG